MHRTPQQQNTAPDGGAGHGAGRPAPKPSALVTATLRAAHQLLDTPLILDDPLALSILGPEQEAALRADTDRFRTPFSAVLRATMAVRSRVAEDSWREARQQGVRQYVVLGAGLDTSAYRGGGGGEPGVRMFEVDLPATQAWKRARLRGAGIAEPAQLRYVAVDFTGTTLERGLAAAGLDGALPAMFSWLGVSMYLAQQDVARALRHVGACAPGSSIVFDYVLPPELLSPIERAGLDAMASRLAEQGEPLLSCFAPATMEEMLLRSGFSRVEHYNAANLGERYLSGRGDDLRLSGVFQLARATV